jgi:ABC-type nickel/cobalt efflux system permease component RcnA
MRRALLLGLLAVAALPAAAHAHPLGNFSVNHLTQVSVSADRVDVHYILDQAEIPTFQERSLSRREVLGRKRAAAAAGLRLTVDGRETALALASGGRLSFPTGQGGLHTTRVELDLSATVSKPSRVQVADDTFKGRVGWKSVIVRPGEGTDVRSSVPSGDPTRGLRTYPAALLQSPSDVRTGSFAVEPGAGTVRAPKAEGQGLETTGDRGGDHSFSSLFDDAAAGKGVLALLLLAAFGWGAVHALSPGHGKAMVAAYLVGTRGTARHAVGLGLVVTATHTAGVFALGFVTLALSQYVLPEDLYPWLNLVSGLLVVVVGAAVLRTRWRTVRAQRARTHAHEHGHHHHHHGEHGHSHDVPPDISPRALVAMGASAGLIPCPSALVVLLGAIAQHQVGLGLVLIVAFSAGLAATLMVLGLIVVQTRRFAGRIHVGGHAAALAPALPAVSALLILGVGVVLTAQALPKL